MIETAIGAIAEGFIARCDCQRHDGFNLADHGKDHAASDDGDRLLNTHWGSLQERHRSGAGNEYPVPKMTRLQNREKTWLIRRDESKWRNTAGRKRLGCRSTSKVDAVYTAAQQRMMSSGRFSDCIDKKDAPTKIRFARNAENSSVVFSFS